MDTDSQDWLLIVILGGLLALCIVPQLGVFALVAGVGLWLFTAFVDSVSGAAWHIGNVGLILLAIGALLALALVLGGGV